MYLSSFIAVAIYLIILIAIGVSSHIKNQTANDFILGGRKMNFWLTALAAHASDMSSWIFMGYPAVVFASGLFNAWAAIGLTFFMFLNWQLVAPRLRKQTERYNSLTISSFFESRFSDTTGILRLFTALISFVYYTIYISSGLVALGLVMETLFGIPYIVGISIGICIIVPYLFIGGYVTLAWTDLFQGLFLMLVIVFVPLYVLPQIGGLDAVGDAISNHASHHPFLPETASVSSILAIIFLACGWGLGYFGQPHIVTKFMGINNPDELPKSKWVGITWQSISLGAATLVGLVGVVYFSSGIRDNQLVFIDMTLSLFPKGIAAFILCAILGATITCMDSQILVLASNMSEDVYKKMIRKTASSAEVLMVSRISIFIVAAISYTIACTTSSTIFGLVSYAWFGLGASFGPLVLFSLYSKKTNRYGAWCGVLTGALLAGFWPLINSHFGLNIPTLIPGFVGSSFVIWAVSSITQYKKQEDVVY